jgi:hypothetical protein
MQNNDFEITLISNLKKGTFFRFRNKKLVYTYSGKDRKYGYHYIPTNDAWGGGYYTKNPLREVEVNFTY